MIPLVSSGERLEALNYILRAAGELQIDSLDDLSPEAEDAELYLDRAMASIQCEGWDFNRDYTQLLALTPVVVTPQTTYWEDTDEYSHIYVTVTGSTEPTFPNGRYRLDRRTPFFGFSETFEWRSSPSTDEYQLIRLLKDDANNGTWNLTLESKLTALPSSVQLFVGVGASEDDVVTFNSNNWVYSENWTGDIPETTNEGLVFVREATVVPAVTENQLVLPNNTIAAVPSLKRDRREWIMRGGKMYNRIENTNLVDINFEIDITYLLDWEDAPLAFREWATYQAAAMYLNDVAQDPTMAQQAQGLASDARRRSQGYHIRNGSFSAKRYHRRA